MRPECVKSISFFFSLLNKLDKKIRGKESSFRGQQTYNISSNLRPETALDRMII